MSEWQASTDTDFAAAVTAEGSQTSQAIHDIVEAASGDVGDSEVAGFITTPGSASQAAVQSLIVEPPVGSITMYGGSTAPTNWLLCQGQAVDRATYADLYDAIGTQFGQGDGATTFNLPDLQHKFPYGSTGSDVAVTGGTDTHVHALSDNGQAVVFMQSSAGNELGMRRAGLTGGAGAQTTHRATGSLGTTADSTAATMGTALRGNTDTASSLPPYLTVQYIIRCL
jgi:microcystin-dependent protein